MKQAPTGSISLTHFTNIYQRFFPFGDPVPFAGLVFRAFDRNESGAIEFEEYVRVLSVTSRGRLEEKMECT
jgi:neuronal calcium sensor 1